VRLGDDVAAPTGAGSTEPASRPLARPGFRERHGLPALGAGVGFRFEHVDEILRSAPDLPWFEVVSENFMGRGGLCRGHLRAAAERWPVVTHGVSMNLGGTDPLDREHLRRLKALCDEVRSPWTSDHLCFTGVDGTALNELLPLPRTDEAVRHVAARVRQVQETLERPFLVENVSSYLDPSPGAMDEAEFARAVCEEADCGLLLDVNNVHVNSVNFGWDAWDVLSRMPLDRVVQLHLAGPEPRGTLLLDSHGAPVRDEVWALTRRLLPLLGPTSALVEWDNRMPPLARLLEEQGKAHALLEEAGVAPPRREARRSARAG
jgi:uncharacterized protein (UPF0276 family)